MENFKKKKINIPRFTVEFVCACVPGMSTCSRMCLCACVCLCVCVLTWDVDLQQGQHLEDEDGDPAEGVGDDNAEEAPCDAELVAEVVGV